MKKAIIAIIVASVVAIGGVTAVTLISKSNNNSSKPKAPKSASAGVQTTQADPNKTWLLVEMRTESKSTRYEYDNDGNCTLYDNGYTRTEKTYQNGKIVKAETYENGVYKGATTYEYDANGNRTKMSDETNGVINSPQPGEYCVITTEYDSENRKTKETYSTNASNYVYEIDEFSYSTNSQGLLVRTRKVYNETSNHKLMYTETSEIDDNGNVLFKKTEQNNGSWSTEKYDVFGNELEIIAYNVSGAKSMNYTDVDSKGHKIRSYHMWENSTVEPNNTPIIDKTYEYDANGNLYKEYHYAAVPENEFNKDDYINYNEFIYKTLADIRAGK